MHMTKNADSNQVFKNLSDLASFLKDPKRKKQTIIFAHNGTGKTRLSMEFRHIAKKNHYRDTLYFNAFTEDLFIWVNDLRNDTKRYLKLKKSHFFDGITDPKFNIYLKKFVSKFLKIDYKIDLEKRKIQFSLPYKKNTAQKKCENIKISRGEEKTFIICFFLAIVRMVAEKNNAYKWVNFIYIDDPISSLDDNYAIDVAEELAEVIHNINSATIKTIISTHHGLFFNVICNRHNKADRYYLKKDNNSYTLNQISDTPFFDHLANLQLLIHAIKSDNIHYCHFNIFRNIVEKTSVFLGYNKLENCVSNKIALRALNAYSHGNHTIEQSALVNDSYKKLLKREVNKFIKKYNFNKDILN